LQNTSGSFKKSTSCFSPFLQKLLSPSCCFLRWKSSANASHMPASPGGETHFLISFSPMKSMVFEKMLSNETRLKWLVVFEKIYFQKS
jgi:hypothetical protein